MVEAWKAARGFPGYWVSNLGRVRSVRKILKALPHKRGYMYVNLYTSVGCKRKTIHSLVLDAFIGPRPADCEASHLDANRANNTLSNLIWESPVENNRRKQPSVGDLNPAAKLTTESVIEIRRLAGLGMTEKGIAQRFGISRSNANSILRGKTWSHIVASELVHQATGTDGDLGGR